MGNGKAWLDNLGTGYYTPQPVKFTGLVKQESRTQDTDKPTEGMWASLLIEHGNAPKNASYEYAVLPNTTREKIDAFAAAPTYKVLRADSVLYSRELRPRMIIEYKAPHIPITQKVFDQISVYNLLLHVDYLVVSNGLEHYICRMDYDDKKYLFLEEIPDYSDLLTI